MDFLPGSRLRKIWGGPFSSYRIYCHREHGVCCRKQYTRVVAICELSSASGVGSGVWEAREGSGGLQRSLVRVLETHPHLIRGRSGGVADVERPSVTQRHRSVDPHTAVNGSQYRCAVKSGFRTLRTRVCGETKTKEYGSCRRQVWSEHLPR